MTPDNDKRAAVLAMLAGAFLLAAIAVLSCC